MSKRESMFKNIYILTKNENPYCGYYLENGTFLTTFGFTLKPSEIKKQISFNEFKKFLNNCIEERSSD